MANYQLTQTGQEIQDDLNKVESLAEIKSIGSGLSLSQAGELSVTGGGGGGAASSVTVLTTAPSSDNPVQNNLIFVILDEEPATKYEGYYYIIRDVQNTQSEE